MSGLLFRADELRDAETRLREYRRRAIEVEARCRYNDFDDPTQSPSETYAWWMRALESLQEYHHRVLRGQKFIDNIRTYNAVLERNRRRLRNNVHPLRSIK